MKTDKEAAELNLPNEIFFEERAGTNGIHCLDYPNNTTIKYIREGHKEESRWIPVTEKMPPLFSDKFGDSDYVLGHEEFGNQSVVCWYNYHTKEWRVAHYKADSLPIKITHWMPLPTPPQTNK